MEIGTCDICRRKGFGVGSNVKIHETEFLTEWGENYAPIVRQLLWYKDKAGNPPSRVPTSDSAAVLRARVRSGINETS